MTDLTVITHDAEQFVAYLHSTGARSVADLSEFERNALRRQLAYERPHLLEPVSIVLAVPDLLREVTSTQPDDAEVGRQLRLYVAQRLDEAADDLFRDEVDRELEVKAQAEIRQHI